MCCLYLAAQVGKANDFQSVHVILLVQGTESAKRKTLRLNGRMALGDVAGSCYQYSHHRLLQDRVKCAVNVEECNTVRLSMLVTRAVVQEKNGSPAIADSVTGDLVV